MKENLTSCFMELVLTPVDMIEPWTAARAAQKTTTCQIK